MRILLRSLVFFVTTRHLNRDVFGPDTQGLHFTGAGHELLFGF